MTEQIRLYNRVLNNSNINIVTCGQCGDVMLHDLDDTMVQCPYCNFTDEPNAFPDLFHEGMEELKKQGGN